MVDIHGATREQIRDANIARAEVEVATTTEILDKLNDILDKLNDIFEKVEEQGNS